MEYNDKLEKMPYTEEERIRAEEIYKARMNHEKLDKFKFTTGLFSAYVEIYSNGEISLLSAFRGMQKSAMFRCSVCGHEWESLPERIYYKNNKCPECRRRERIAKLKLINLAQSQDKVLENLDEEDILQIKENIAEKTIEEAMLNKPKNVKKTSDNSITEYLAYVEPSKLDNTEKLLDALNGNSLLYGAYSTRSKALLLYTIFFYLSIIFTHLLAKFFQILYNY